MQFALFPVSLYLQRICAEKNEWRYYAMSIQPDLFGGAFLMRRWGRIGTGGHLRLDQYADEGAATNALAYLAQKKLKRGYRVIAQDALLFS